MNINVVEGRTENIIPKATFSWLPFIVDFSAVLENCINIFLISFLYYDKREIIIE